MISFIKSFCKYRRFMSNASTRQEFEEYLQLEVHNKESESLYILPASLIFQSPRLAQQETAELLLWVMPVFAWSLARSPALGYKAKTRPAQRGWSPSGFCSGGQKGWRMTSRKHCEISHFTNYFLTLFVCHGNLLNHFIHSTHFLRMWQALCRVLRIQQRPCSIGSAIKAPTGWRARQKIRAMDVAARLLGFASTAF